MGQYLRGGATEEDGTWRESEVYVVAAPRVRAPSAPTHASYGHSALPSPQQKASASPCVRPPHPSARPYSAGSCSSRVRSPAMAAATPGGAGGRAMML